MPLPCSALSCPVISGRIRSDRIEQAIKTHITEATREGNGYLRVPCEGLVRVYTVYLANLGGGVQFACVDLVGAGGPVFDVDFFVKGLPGPATVTETSPMNGGALLC